MCQTRKFDETKIDELIKDCSEILNSEKLDSEIIEGSAYKRLQSPSVVLFWRFSDEQFLRLSTEIKGLWSNDKGDKKSRNFLKEIAMLQAFTADLFSPAL